MKLDYQQKTITTEESKTIINHYNNLIGILLWQSMPNDSKLLKLWLTNLKKIVKINKEENKSQKLFPSLNDLESIYSGNNTHFTVKRLIEEKIIKLINWFNHNNQITKENFENVIKIDFQISLQNGEKKTEPTLYEKMVDSAEISPVENGKNDATSLFLKHATVQDQEINLLNFPA